MFNLGAKNETFFFQNTVTTIDLVLDVHKAALLLSIALSNENGDAIGLSSDFNCLHYREKICVCISCSSRRRRKSVPNFSFPTSFNQTTASSSNQAFLRVLDRPPRKVV